MLKSYKCSIDGEQWTTINAISRGAAKSRFFRTFDSDIEYTWVRCKANGLHYTSDEFKHNAKYRGVEFAFVGMDVKVSNSKGVIVGHNRSANLDVLFTDGILKGQVCNCHPHWKITYFDKKGGVVKSFNE
mgnify:CR=1 FL=1